MREVVQWFGERMEEELSKNDHKRGWYGETPGWLFRRLRQELDELGRALRGTRHMRSITTEQQANEIIAEAADVANFAMMIADKARQKRGSD